MDGKGRVNRPESRKLAYSYREAAEVTGLGKRTIERLIHTGELPCVQVRGRRVIRHEALAEYLKKREIRSLA